MDFGKKVTAFILCALLVFTVTPRQLLAGTAPAVKPQAPSPQIQLLLKEVARLQALLSSVQTKPRAPLATNTPYKAVLFPIAFEATYRVENGRLTSLTPGRAVSAIDTKLFALFVDTLGEANVAKYVREWRIFYQSDSDLGAFTEYMPAAGAWLVGVNREGFIAGDREEEAAFAHLFIHEFAHIALFKKPAMETNFSKLFWTASDISHAQKVKNTSADERFSVLSRYYENNTSRFVSDYATLKPSEDVTETFVAFVLEEKPLGYTVRDQKIRLFYANTELVALRSELRTNLFRLGAL